MLQSQLQQKNVEVSEFKELLSVARRDLAEAVQQHTVEVANLQTRLAAKTEESFIKFKQYAQVSQNCCLYSFVSLTTVDFMAFFLRIIPPNELSDSFLNE